jgi:protein O-GlcNAc transferase
VNKRVATMGRSLAVDPKENKEFQRALAVFQAGNLKDAEHLFKAVLRARPRHVAALNLLGIVLTQLEKFAEAEFYLRRALHEYPNSDATQYNYGIVLKVLHRPAEALEHFTRALAINPTAAETWNNRGTVYSDLNFHDKAIADFEKAIALNPRFAGAFCNKAKALAILKRLDEALSAFEAAQTLNPGLAEAWHGYGNVCCDLKRYETALAAFEKALTIRPDLAEAWFDLGNLFTELGRWTDAYSSFDKAFSLKPDLKHAEDCRLLAKLYLCDWTNLDAEVSHLTLGLRSRRAVSRTLLCVKSSPVEQRQSAELDLADLPRFQPVWDGQIYSHDRIRIAYASADFHEHPTAYLTAGLFEHHDKSRFDVTGISFGPEQASETRRRIKASFERFIDVRVQSDGQIAELIRQLEIDIVVDLKGLSTGSRPGIFARRPAPIQVNYLVYPGTLGAEYFDYIIADPVVIPEGHFEFYSEKVVWLPNSYQVNDSRRLISEHMPIRRECALPEVGFVFCCFNSHFKIMPEIFQIWMGLLNAIEGSVLWMIEGDAATLANLRRRAELCGISAERLIFAPRLALADHLARHRLANLFLDTLPYNAHTTASDALWAGLPVLTCLGSTFAGRVAASLLQAAGLGELITKSLDDYEALALKLAHEPALLASLKAKLVGNRGTCPLFDTERFTRHIEAAYVGMWQAQRHGRPPASFAVEAGV